MCSQTCATTTATAVVSSFKGANMNAGRPSYEESEQRRHVFVGLVAAGVPLHQAARTARIKPLRALKLLDTPEMRQILAEAA